MKKYVVFKCSTKNLGDDIQSVAVERLLPRVDLRIDCDDLSLANDLDEDTDWEVTGNFFATLLAQSAPVASSIHALRSLFTLIRCLAMNNGS